MSKIKKFEDLIAWQKARELTRIIYYVTKQEAFAKDFGLSGQIQRAVVSIMSNISEGFERGSPKQFSHFLTLAKGSCAEVRSQNYIALDIGYLTNIQFLEISSRTDEISKIIQGLRASIYKQNF